MKYHWILIDIYLLSFIVAHEDGRFVEEIVPVSVKGKKGPEEFKMDEHPKPNSTIENLAKLPPVFKKDGTVTAANASVRYYQLIINIPIVNKNNYLLKIYNIF